MNHIEGAAKAVDLVLTPEETAYLGRTIRTAPAGGSYGAEYTGSGERRSCMVNRRSGNQNRDNDRVCTPVIEPCDICIVLYSAGIPGIIFPGGSREY